MKEIGSTFDMWQCRQTRRQDLVLLACPQPGFCRRGGPVLGDSSKGGSAGLTPEKFSKTYTRFSALYCNCCIQIRKGAADPQFPLTAPLTVCDGWITTVPSRRLSRLLSVQISLPSIHIKSPQFCLGRIIVASTHTFSNSTRTPLLNLTHTHRSTFLLDVAAFPQLTHVYEQLSIVGVQVICN